MRQRLKRHLVSGRSDIHFVCIVPHSAGSNVLRPQLYQDSSQILDVRDIFGPINPESIVSVKRPFAFKSVRSIGNKDTRTKSDVTKHNRLERVFLVKYGQFLSV
jgi:hypothetical protein